MNFTKWISFQHNDEYREYGITMLNINQLVLNSVNY